MNGRCADRQVRPSFGVCSLFVPVHARTSRTAEVVCGTDFPVGQTPLVARLDGLEIRSDRLLFRALFRHGNHQMIQRDDRAVRDIDDQSGDR